MDSDYLYALSLQEQFSQEFQIVTTPVKKSINQVNTSTTRSNNKHINSTDGSQSNLIDPSWEFIDPTPDIYSLFIQFDKRFFWTKLTSVIVKWSKRMTTCAGVCSYEGRGGACTVSLSEPLLKLRPRKDLIETLLHEMIHAYLFVTNNNRDRDGHGPEFHKHMNRINSEAGTKISVYHNFHDEVKLYQTHWWRCNGICQHRKPYFGMVKRASNRKPGPNDFWWSEHEKNCGGTFVKIREPEGKTKKGSLPTKSVPVSDIRKYIPVESKKSVQKNSTGVTAIKTIKDLQPDKLELGECCGTQKPKSTSNESSSDIFKPFDGRGNTLKNKSPLSFLTRNTGVDDDCVFTNTHQVRGENDAREKVRNVWAKKYDGVNKRSMSDSHCNKKIKSDPTEDTLSKITSSIETNSPKVKCPVCSKDVIEKEMNIHLDQCIDSSINEEEDMIDLTNNTEKIACLVCNKEIDQCELNSHLESCIGSVFDEDMVENTKPARTQVEHSNSLVACPCCSKMIEQNEINGHLDSCVAY